MPFVEITFNVVAGGGPRKIGDRLELSTSEARLLVGANRAKFVEQPSPVVIDEPAVTPPAKKTRKPRGKKTASTPTPCETGNCPVPTPVTEDAETRDTAI